MQRLIRRLLHDTALKTWLIRRLIILRGRLPALLARARGLTPLHLIHIGKTGGTTIKHALSGLRRVGNYRLIMNDHGFKLAWLGPGEKAIVFLRDPIGRYRSGFAAAQREGRPRYHVRWSAGEREAFAIFTSDNQLAEALDDPDPARREAAVKAMNALRHVRSHYSYALGDPAALARQRDKIVFAGSTENLDRDFELMKRKLGLPADLRLPQGETDANQAPDRRRQPLSERALRNLRQWYREDIEIYEFFKAELFPKP